MRLFPVVVAGLAAFAQSKENNVRCRSEPPQGFLADSRALQKRGLLDKYVVPVNQSKLLLDAYFHVVTATPNEITEEQLHQQIGVLNDNFQPYDIQFKLRDIDWTLNATWANNTYDYWMKKKLHRGDYKTLNVYFISRMTSGGLGNHTDPSFDIIRFMDGCTVDAQTVPGGKRKEANLGKTTTHEVGHWFGLYHTFYGGCTFGDGINDTPAQGEPGSPEFGCDKPRDTCPDQPGNDPMFNQGCKRV
ncbi:hypothetical protein FDECE_18440, partial [Fusarium decemcellulare]